MDAYPPRLDDPQLPVERTLLKGRDQFAHAVEQRFRPGPFRQLQHDKPG